jgi:hypothetical protein
MIKIGLSFEVTFNFHFRTKSVIKTNIKHAASTKSWLRHWEICVSALNLSCLRQTFKVARAAVKHQRFLGQTFLFASLLAACGVRFANARSWRSLQAEWAFRKAACAYFPYLVHTRYLMRLSVRGTLWPICQSITRRAQMDSEHAAPLGMSLIHALSTCSKSERDSDCWRVHTQDAQSSFN